MNKKIIITIVSLIIIAVSYWLISPIWRNTKLNEDLSSIDKVISMSEAMPENKPQIIAKADMIAQAHEVKGSALFVKSGNNIFLRFENLKTINGPDLRIYLSSDLNANDIIDLGPIRATEGNVNYTIPQGTDLNKYKNVMIWCRAFSVLFSYAVMNTEEVKTDVMMNKVGSYESYAKEKIAMASNDHDVVLFFRAGWCPTCRAVDADIKANLGKIPSNLTILDVDYDNSTELKQKYGVTYQHTFVQVDKDGKLIKKWSGSPTLTALVAEVK